MFYPQSMSLKFWTRKDFWLEMNSLMMMTYQLRWEHELTWISIYREKSWLIGCQWKNAKAGLHRKKQTFERSEFQKYFYNNKTDV